MKRLWGWLGAGGAASDKTEGNQAPRPRLGAGELEELVRHFPIGSRIRYFPEFQRSIKLDSVVLAYQINDSFIFSAHDVRVINEGGAPALWWRAAPRERQATSVDRFHIVVPQLLRQELDYSAASSSATAERLSEKTVNDFRRGNTITLFNNGANGQVPHVDTTVIRVTEMKEGLYKNRHVVWLEPDPNSFVLQEQRELHRVYTSIPATLTVPPTETPVVCSIVDFSERFARIVVAEPAPCWVEAREEARLQLSIPAPHQNRTFLLKAKIHRKERDYSVVALTAIWKDKRFQNLDLIDELDLKTSLLHHPETLKSQATET